jgi:hypothetical protein
MNGPLRHRCAELQDYLGRPRHGRSVRAGEDVPYTVSLTSSSSTLDLLRAILSAGRKSSLIVFYARQIQAYPSPFR